MDHGHVVDAILWNRPWPWLFKSLPDHLTSWVPGRTPLSSKASLCVFLTLYFTSVYSIQSTMDAQKPYSLQRLFRFYNLFLATGSLILLVLMINGAWPLVRDRGFLYSICSEEAWTPKMEFYYMINYYFKYVELLDTLFTVLRKKPLNILHVYHHSATVLLTYLLFDSQLSVVWFIISLNLFTHVLIYHYYYASTRGIKIWWKRYISWIQILQFVVDLALAIPWGYSNLIMPLSPQLPQIETCAGNPKIAIFGFFVILSYLVLFFNYYFQPLQYIKALLILVEIRELLP